jgi:sulfide:quinone oxidoreductase
MEQPARIVIAGGGVAALEAAIALRALLGSEPSITMVAPNEHFVHQPLSVGEPFAMGDTPRLPLAKFADDLDIQWRKAGVTGVGENRAVLLDDGSFIVYDRLIVAMGAPREAVYEHATTFRGENDTQAVHGLVQDVEMGNARRIAFVVPQGVAWSLPLYELALMTARRAWEMNVDVELSLVTPEERPLEVFGVNAAADVEQRLEEAGIGLHLGTVADIPSKGHVVLPGGETIECERVIALPCSRGPRVDGLPADEDGFIPIDSNARVVGMDNVYAAGDGANFPLKQGGLACQQADAAAEHIAWSLGRLEQPEPFRPVLRGQLLTGDKPQFMRRDVTEGAGVETSEARPLWSPATKVSGKYLSRYLAEPGATDDALETPLRGDEYADWGARARS